MLARINSGSQNSFCVWSQDPKFRCKKDLVFPQPVNGHYSQPTATIQDRRTLSSPPLPMDKWVSLPSSPFSLETLLCVHMTTESWKQLILLPHWHVCWPWVPAEAVQVMEEVCNSSQNPHLQMQSQRWILASSHSSSQMHSWHQNHTSQSDWLSSAGLWLWDS